MKSTNGLVHDISYFCNRWYTDYEVKNASDFSDIWFLVSEILDTETTKMSDFDLVSEYLRRVSSGTIWYRAQIGFIIFHFNGL